MSDASDEIPTIECDLSMVGWPHAPHVHQEDSFEYWCPGLTEGWKRP